jgi:hypothetical protein
VGRDSIAQQPFVELFAIAMARAAFNKAAVSCSLGSDDAQSCVMQDVSTTGSPGQFVGQALRKLDKV